MLDFLLLAVRLVLGAAALLFLLYVPGAVVLNSLASRRSAPHLFSGVEEWLFSALLLSVLVTGSIGFILAEVGWFYWWAVLPAVLLFSVAMSFVGQAPFGFRILLKVPGSYPQRAADRRMSNMHRLALLAILAVAAALFSRPAEMLRGALDSGVYVNAGVALGRTGAIFQRDPLMRRLNDDAGETKELMLGLNPDRYVLKWLRMPGFYAYDKQASLVAPQHYSLYPVWIGLLYMLFGIWGALYATPLLMMVALLAVYFFARRAFAPSAALLGLALLALCPVIPWFARYPVSEVITCLLSFAAFYSFMRMAQLTQERDQPDEDDDQHLHAESAPRDWAALWGVVAGLSLGQLALARPDFIFHLAPVPLYLLYWRLSRRWRRPYTWFVSTLGIVLGVYAAHYFFYSYPYTIDLYFNVIKNIRKLWSPLLLTLYLGVLLLVALDRMYPRLRPIWRRLSSLAARYRWAWAGALVLTVGAYAFYHYAIGPWQPNVRFDKTGQPLAQTVVTTWESYIGARVDLGSRYNLLRIGWYLSPLGVLLGVAGLLRWVWNRLDASKGLFLGSLLVTSFVFIEETYTNPHYIYSMRRYLPVLLPALILGAAWACQFCWSRIRPRPLGVGVAAAAALGLALFFVYTNRVLMPHVEEEGAVGQLSSLADRFPEKSVVLFSNERDEPYVVATPLQYIYGIDSFVLVRNYPSVNNTILDKVVKDWQKDGYKVWAMLGANGGKLDLPSFSLKEEGSWVYDVPELEQLTYQKPLNISHSRLPWGIYSLQPRPASPQPSWPFKVDIGEMDYKWLVAGFHIEERAESDASAWRWTGDTAVLRLPWPSTPDGKTLDGGKITLRLRPESPAPGKPIRRTQPVTVTLALEDTPVGEVVVPPGTRFADYTVQVPAGITKKSAGEGTVLLFIKPSTWSADSDTRALGVQADEIVLSFEF